jgi:hypothetical protein
MLTHPPTHLLTHSPIAGLRGFSEVLRVGRYAYFAPLLYTTHIYTSNVLRLYLGTMHALLTHSLTHSLTYLLTYSLTCRSSRYW